MDLLSSLVQSTFTILISFLNEYRVASIFHFGSRINNKKKNQFNEKIGWIDNAIELDRSLDIYLISDNVHTMEQRI